MNIPLVISLVYLLLLLLVVRSAEKRFLAYEERLQVADNIETNIRADLHREQQRNFALGEKHARLLGETAQLQAMNDKLKLELRRKHRRTRV